MKLPFKKNIIPLLCLLMLTHVTYIKSSDESNDQPLKEHDKRIISWCNDRLSDGALLRILASEDLEVRVDIPYQENFLPLCKAIRDGKPQIVKALFKHRAPFQIKTGGSTQDVITFAIAQAQMVQLDDEQRDRALEVVEALGIRLTSLLEIQNSIDNTSADSMGLARHEMQHAAKRIVILQGAHAKSMGILFLVSFAAAVIIPWWNNRAVEKFKKEGIYEECIKVDSADKAAIEHYYPQRKQAVQA
jgi:hypothetical protein